MPIIVGGQVLVIIANSIQFVYAADIANNVALCYFCVFMALAGAYPIIPGVMAWQLNNLAGPLRRAMGIALMVCLGNVGGIIGSVSSLPLRSVVQARCACMDLFHEQTANYIAIVHLPRR
jgi:hypothetical protein